MSVSGKNRHYALATIMRSHFNSTAAKCGWGADAEDIINELLDEVEPAIATVENLLPDGFPEDVATSILTGISLQARELRNQPST